MYGKLFKSAYTGSMYGAGFHVFAVLGWAIANADRKGYVDLNPKALAPTLGGSIQDVEAALEYLQRPDPDSRSPDEDGRRLVREGAFLYRIVNYLKYRDMRDENAKREGDRDRQRKHRAAQNTARHTPSQDVTPRHVLSQDVTPVTPGHAPSQNVAQVEVEVEVDVKKKDSVRKPPLGFALFEIWNTFHGSLPSCREFSEKRKTHAAARLKEHPDLEEWTLVVKKLAATPFCLGENERGWKADFDFLLQPDTRIKVLEGKYDGKNGNGTKPLPSVGANPATCPRHWWDSDAPSDIREIGERMEKRIPLEHDDDAARLIAWQQGKDD